MKRLAHNVAARLIVLHRNRAQASHDSADMLAFAVSNQPLASVTLNLLSRRLFSRPLVARHNSVIVVPRWWTFLPKTRGIVRYGESLPLPDGLARHKAANAWLVVENAGIAADFDRQLLAGTLERLDCDILAVNITARLRASYEKVLTDSHNCLAGFRMLYEDSSEPGRLETQNWPHYLFIKTRVLDLLTTDGSIPADFGRLVKIIRSRRLVLRAVNIGGNILDLATEQGLLAWLRLNLDRRRPFDRPIRRPTCRAEISDSARFFGKVLLGQNVRIGPDAVIAGPAILCSGVEIGAAAAISSSVIGSQITVPAGSFVAGCVLGAEKLKFRTQKAIRNTQPGIGNMQPFRCWPKLSYAGCFKRIADIFAAIIVLLIFGPVFPLIALAIKLSSRGPVFFKDTRQGLHGRKFKCLKFRTMRIGANKMQDRLRVINLADGPQFRLADDPRINPVGRFLRDTFLDEIPQFANVLLGQMSVVGPRPSPEPDNMLCPSWRDARLSVRPGITGLWQVRRTRRPGKDFQEWIYYDMMYVRKLSLSLDIRICWQTAKKMLAKFVEQF